jgi:hypothetical protein
MPWLKQKLREISARTRQFAKLRSSVALGTFVIAMVVSLNFPLWCFGLICCVLFLYLRPEPPQIGREVARKVALSDE